MDRQNQDNNFRALKKNLGLKFMFPNLPTVIMSFLYQSPSVHQRNTMHQSTAWPVLLTLAAMLVAGTTGFASPLLMPTILGADAKTCPAPMKNFELSEVCATD